MKTAVVEYRKDKPAVIEKPQPGPDAGEMLVRTLQVDMDGTGYEATADGHSGFPRDEDHLVLGHGAIGVVTDPNDTESEKGDVIASTVRRPPASRVNRYFEENQPDVAPDGMYAEHGIVDVYGLVSEYFTSPSDHLVYILRSRAEFGFLIEPISIIEKMREHAYVSRSVFDWSPSSALVLGNGSLGLLTLAILRADGKGCEDLYCLSQCDRPDPTIGIIEKLGMAHVDSCEMPVEEIPSTHEDVDFIYGVTGFLKHATQSMQALALSGIATLLDVPSDWEFEVDTNAFRREMVLHDKVLVDSVNSHVKYFEVTTVTFTKLPR